MLIVVVQNVITLNVAFTYSFGKCHYAMCSSHFCIGECHNAERRYDECRGAHTNHPRQFLAETRILLWSCKHSVTQAPRLQQNIWVFSPSVSLQFHISLNHTLIICLSIENFP